jgi:hypothetical protein
MHAYRSPRPSGLKYSIVAVNRGWRKKGERLWNAGLTGLPATAGSFKPGQHVSPETEFRRGQRPWNEGSVGVMPRGADHHAWAGDLVGYQALHSWVSRQREKPESCEECGSGRFVDWSNISGDYRRDMSDWRALCRRCHFRYDRKVIPGASKRMKERRRSCVA